MTSDEKSQDKLALSASQAGMRLIAQTTLYNQQNEARLLQFIQESYSTSQLELHPAEARLNDFRAMFETLKRQKVKQVLATSKHHVIVALEAETGGLYYCEVACEDDYPHKITNFMHQKLEEASD